MPQIFAPLAHEVKLSAYYRSPDNALHQLDAWVAIDPEGATEEDAARLRHETMKHLSMTQEVFIEPILVLIKGGKA